ncbi:MAG TPA: hypothetical protein VGD61_27715 [Pyrinomonadaceae bacterium]
MSEAKPKPAADATEFDAFQDLARKLVAVPKKEIDREAAKYERKKAKAKQK